MFLSLESQMKMESFESQYNEDRFFTSTNSQSEHFDVESLLVKKSEV